MSRPRADGCPATAIDGSRGGDGVVTYQRAGWVFWMLRGLMGEEPLLAGLRDFITTWRDGVAIDDGLDFPLVEDLLASLRPHAPDAAVAPPLAAGFERHVAAGSARDTKTLAGGVISAVPSATMAAFPCWGFFMRHAAARLARRLPLLAALVLLPAARAADDVVAEEKPTIGFGEAAVGADVEPAPDAKDPLAGYLSALADGPVVLAWKEGRLIVDVPATQAALHGEDFARMRQAVENTLDRAGKLLVEEGVAQGLPRDQAEMLFGGAREKLAADPNDAMGFPRGFLRGPRQSQPLFRDVGPAEVAEAAFTQALDKAAAQGHVAGHGGQSSSATDAGRETTHQRGQFRLRLRARPGEWSAAATDGSRSLSFAVAAEPRLSLTLGAGGDVADDDGDEEGETVLVRQTAKAFRARIVRAGKEVLKLEAGSFRDCCRTDPEGVRRELAPLLKRIGIRLPPMPDDAAVKAEVVARLRKAAGMDQPGGAQEVAPAALEARKQRATQLAATIDAFGLLDDRRYLEDLKPTVAAEDARAIDARLAALAASPGK